MLNRLKSLLFVCIAALGIVSCDSDTYMLGNSITNDMDHLQVSSNTFELTTRSILSDAVIARNTISYLGTVKDPETGEYITANYMTQFHTLENYDFPDKKLIKSLNEDGEVIADSCELRLYFDSFYGDSLAAMKLSVSELAEPMREDQTYLSDFDLREAGLIRNNAMNVNYSYSLRDNNLSDATLNSDAHSANIRIMLNKPYTDKQGKTYNNYGSYIMNKYYENPENFKNSVRLTNNVMPGLYIESTGGLGSMAYIKLSQINMFFSYGDEKKDTTYYGTGAFAGTEEVLQHTQYINDTKCLQKLVEDETCTYLKTPSGIFTEIEFPIDDVLNGHDNDTINSAKFTLQRLNNTVESNHSFAPASTVLLIPADSLNSFFENRDIANFKTSYVASYDTASSTYVFNNVSSLISAMHHAKQNGETSENWNKAVIIPVTVTTNSSGATTKIVHDMSLTSTRLMGGAANPRDPITLSVIYSRYK